MDAIIIIEWSYTPADYFEVPINIVRDQYEMNMVDGKVEANIQAEYYDEDHKMRDQLHSALNDRFLGVQVLTHKLRNPGHADH